MNNDIKFSSNQNWPTQNYSSNIESKKAEKDLEKATDQKVSSSLKHSPLENAPVIQEIYDNLFKENNFMKLDEMDLNVKDFEKATTTKVDAQKVKKESEDAAKGLNEKEMQNMQESIQNQVQKVHIDGKQINLEKAIFEHFNGKDFTEEGIRKFITDMHQKGLLQQLDSTGKLISLTDEEVEALIELTLKFIELYFQLANAKTDKDEDKNNLQYQNGPQLAQNAAETAGARRAAKVAVANSKENKQLHQILVQFQMLQLAIEQQRIKEKKEKLRELADLANREAIKLKELKLEQTHESINAENIDKEQLNHDEIKQILEKMQSILTPLQVFSKAAGGLKLIQIEGDVASPLKSHVVREYNLESPFKKGISSHDISLLRVSHHVKMNPNAVAA